MTAPDPDDPAELFPARVVVWQDSAEWRPWMDDPSLTVPAFWWQPGSGRWDDLQQAQPPPAEPEKQYSRRVRRSRKPATGQSSFLNQDEASSDGKYDDTKSTSRRR